MTKKRIAELYRFLSVASMKRMNEDEKVAFIRLLRTMKPVFVEVQTAINDAVEKANKDCDSQADVIALVNRAMEDIWKEDCAIIVNTMTADAFERLCLSNDWNFAMIDEIEKELVTS